MNQRTYINLNGQSNSFKYIVEYINDQHTYINNDNVCWSKINSNINIYKKNEIFIEMPQNPHDGDLYYPYTGDIKLSLIGDDVISKYAGKIKLFTYEDDDWMMFDRNIVNKIKFIRRNNNEWLLGPSDPVSTSFIPKNINTTKVRLYFPTFSIDTYERGVKYILSINTWVNGQSVYLGNYIISRTDALASDNVIHDGEISYYEYVDFDIINPYDIIYSKEWMEFRGSACDKTIDINEGSNLYVSLTPVTMTEDGSKYIKMKEYSGGQGFINIYPDVTKYLNVKINYIHDTPDKVIANVIVNENYNKDIKKYIDDTYDIVFDSMRAELAILDEDSAYRLIPPTSYNEDNNEFIFNRSDLFDSNNAMSILCFPNWEGWHEGMYMIASVTFVKDGVDTITIFSNKIILTKELFKYLVGDKKIYNINLDDMKILNINAVNKIEQNIIQMDKPSDSKSNIISPVFFRSQEVSNIYIHPEVIENIAINLDNYKSLVSTFVLQVEGVSFNEVGRTSSGVIFKIVGKSLPNIVKEGIYFITDTEGNMVTNGKYKYVE